VLARLDAIPGVLEARVDWSGRWFLVQSTKDVSAAACDVLGKGAAPAGAAITAEKTASFRRGDVWLKRGETMKLSEQEAAVLAPQIADAAARDASLDADARAALEPVIREEMLKLFRAAESGIDNLRKGWIDMADAVAARSREFLDVVQAAAVAESIKRR
jgi:hypothetical protein